jgi:sugar/nucleoside kinase (ribokinase family)
VSPPVALVVGHVSLDRVGGGAVPGGSAYYAAHALAGLGARVHVLTAAGPEWPREALTPTASPTSTPTPTPTASPTSTPTPTPTATAPIEALILPSPATTTFENAYGPDGRRSQRVHAAAPPLDPAALPEAWRTPDLLLLAPILGEVDPPAFTRAVRPRMTGLCVQGLVRGLAPDGAVVPRRLSGSAAALGGIHLAVLAEDEAAGQPDLVALLVAAVPLVALTRGALGCDLLGARGGRHVGVHPAAEVDPTGAGDVFAAAMLLALARGEEPAAAARLGAAAASIVVEGRGGEALPRIGEAWARAARVPTAR